MIAWIDDLLSAVEQYRGVKRATKKARVKKAPSKEKLISKLKYAKENKELKIVSINPADILGAQELWMYNAKTRKLGKYVAASFKTLSVKGTSIENFDTDKSVCKTLRKPDEKLKEFARAGKVQLRKFLEDIRATETKLNGRINEDILLLKVV
jgi:mannitol-specific phosphotransferase system IIBC component